MTTTTATSAPMDRLAVERALLGAMLLSERAIDAARSLRPGDFAAPDHGEIFQAVMALHGEGTHADPVTVGEHLGSDPGLMRFLLALQATAPATTLAPQYVAALKGPVPGSVTPDPDGVYRPARVGGDHETAGPLVTIRPIPGLDVPCVSVMHFAGQIGEIWPATDCRRIAAALNAAADDAEARSDLAGASCESCGEPADVRRDDGHTWCQSCDGAAVAAGYDDDDDDGARR